MIIIISHGVDKLLESLRQDPTDTRESYEFNLESYAKLERGIIYGRTNPTRSKNRMSENLQDTRESYKFIRRVIEN